MKRGSRAGLWPQPQPRNFQQQVGKQHSQGPRNPQVGLVGWGCLCAETSARPSEDSQGGDAWLWQVGGFPVWRRLGLGAKMPPHPLLPSSDPVSWQVRQRRCGRKSCGHGPPEGRHRQDGAPMPPPDCRAAPGPGGAEEGLSALQPPRVVEP
eukprot:bmy_12294T0